MCNRYFRDSDKQRLVEAFYIGNREALPLEIAPSYNIAPTTMQPVIRSNRDTAEREMVAMRWGMVPHFAKSFTNFKGYSMFNARAESLTTSATWRGPFQRRRCLVPADGFYEWKRMTEKTKQPYTFTLKSREPFAFAGLWDAWKEPVSGDWLQSFAIVTTEPNELTATVHDRMPVILKRSDYDRWLTRDEAERPPVDLLRPYEAREMIAYPVDPRVGNVRINEPGLCKAYVSPLNSV
jgi:putative SOS response-associated peptidase YedK